MKNRLLPSLLLLASLAASCGRTPEEPAGPEPEPGPVPPAEPIVIPPRGMDATLDLGTWNLQWFGSSSNGPSNESLQLSNVRDVIAGSDLDIWGLVEVVGSSRFQTLVSELPGYAGLLANDPSVKDGAFYYSINEQKVGLLYKTSLASVVSARLILTSHDSDFAGRPPLEVLMRVSLNDHTEDLVVIALHAKAFNDEAAWLRRSNASQALHAYLDSTWPSTKVMVLGDWNDDVDTSITPGMASPYQNFVDDSLDYSFPTRSLSDSLISTTLSYPDAIDHQLVSNELQVDYVSGSVEAYRVDSYIPNYRNTTSDHLPVLSRYDW